ncbi:MAG: 1,4-alpha-glucan branching protein GlgB, partial [Negativicutes bacterium]|nr:1,4-alpha-glucan branching protein GlgB [Negativicutes bacterium]
VVTELAGYQWQDQEWQENRRRRRAHDPEPCTIYEVHFGSWKQRDGQPLTYRQLADELVDYLADMGYTYVEVMPLSEYPLDASWGYQVTGYYALTARYGRPHDFMYFVDRCHQRGIGVLMDWVPGHFCKDAHGLRLFDGGPCYEYADPQRAENEQWGTNNFDLGRTEVQSFLISNAMFWMDVYHIDGLRVDAVANMLYRDFGKKEGEWSHNIYGGRENLEAIGFIRKLNEAVFEFYPGAAMMAEESTTWPMITRPTYIGGLGFSDKWNMGWMNDMLKYMSHDPIYRKYHHNQLTFSMTYAFSENFVLPLSHDEVVHGKKSLIDKMPGDYWQKFANLRLLYGFMYGHPGKKLLFMGGEFGQFIEWRFAEGLEWHLLGYEKHRQLQDFVRDLNRLYRQEKSLWQREHDWNGFQWIDCSDFEKSVVSFVRIGEAANDFMVVACNFTPVERRGYRIGVPGPGKYREVLSSDWRVYGGTGDFDNPGLSTENTRWNNYDTSIVVNLPPLATIFLKPDGTINYKLAEIKPTVKMTAGTVGHLAGEPAVHAEEEEEEVPVVSGPKQIGSGSRKSGRDGKAVPAGAPAPGKGGGSRE